MNIPGNTHLGRHHLPGKITRPVFTTLNPKMVVAILGQLAIPAGTFQYTLSQGYRCGNTVDLHFLHGRKLILVNIINGIELLGLQRSKNSAKGNKTI
jgi:hypothetical protein